MGKKVAVFALGEKTLSALENQIRAFFKKGVDISGYCLENMDDASPAVPADLAVISSNVVLPFAMRHLSSTTKTLVVRRSLSVDALDKLLALPPETKLLACHKYPAGAREVAASVKELGISHVECHSLYDLAHELSSAVTTAVVAGDRGVIPAWVTKIIDIGPREAELASLVEIAHIIGYPLGEMGLLSLRYTKEIARRSELLKQALRNNELLHNQIKVVLNTVQDALIGVDNGNYIRVFNQPASKLLGEGRPLAGRHLPEVLLGYKSVPTAEYTAEGGSLLTIGNKTYHMTVSPVKDDGGAALGAVIALREATDVIRMENEVRAGLKARGHVARYIFSDILGVSPAIRGTLNTAQKLAASDLNVLISGENGTGKELFAQSIHNASARRSGPFVAANCAALPASLIESELFGYEEGAFTGARKGGKPGLIEQAHGGTIFLDEIGDISCETQARLLRVIQEKEVMRVGCTKIIPVDVRIIAATNRDLRKLVAGGRFREDLYYRLFVAPLYIPPLRARKQDIPYLTRCFLAENNLPDEVLDASLLQALAAYSWPGNVRELQSLVQYAAVIADTPPEAKQVVLQRIGGQPGDAAHLPVSMSSQDLPLYKTILEIYEEAKGLSITLGRGALRQHLRSRGFNLGEQVIRRRLDVMKNAGLLTAGKGRQATSITVSGEQLLQTFRR